MSPPYLYPEPLKLTADELVAVHAAMYSLERPLIGPIPDATEFHAYDPLPFPEFLVGIRAAMRATDGRRFLDIGCGLGRNLAIAHYLGCDVAGIDRHAFYVQRASEICPFAQLRVADAFDVEAFDADIVYMYRPAVSDDLEASLEAHVVDRCSPGTVLYLPCRTFRPEWGEALSPELGVLR